MMLRKIPIMMLMPTTIISSRELFWRCIRLMKLKSNGIAWVNWVDKLMKTTVVSVIWILKMTVPMTVMVYPEVKPSLMIVVFVPVETQDMLPIVIKMTAVIVLVTMLTWIVMVTVIYRMQPILMIVENVLMG